MSKKRDVENLKTLGWSSEKIAVRLGLSVTAVQKIEWTLAREEMERKRAEARRLSKKRRDGK